jgi:predicted dehydrogenase
MPPGDSVAEGYSQRIVSDEAYPAVTPDDPPAGLDQAGIDEHRAFVNYYIHQVNLMRHLLGEPYAVRYADPAGVVMAATSASGIPAVLEMAPYHTTRDWQEHALIGFDRGYVRIDLPAPLAFNRPGEVTVFSDPGGGATPTTMRPTLPWVHAMRQQARNFIKACRGEGTDLCSAEEAAQDLAIADRYLELRRAARSAPLATAAGGAR